MLIYIVYDKTKAQLYLSAEAARGAMWDGARLYSDWIDDVIEETINELQQEYDDE